MKIKNLIQKIFIKFAKEELPGCDFDFGELDDNFFKNLVCEWMRKNDNFIDKEIKKMEKK